MDVSSGSNTNSVSAKPTRIYYIDWLRVLAMLSVFLFHSNRFFTTGSWHINNAERSLISDISEQFFNLWMMPLLFFLSGTAVYFSLKFRAPGEFLKERIVRILVPLVGVGIFILAPIQIYLERLTHGDFNGTFLQFYPHYFDGLYGFGGNFAWMGVHLWYLMELFLFSLVALPLFITRRGSGESIISRFANRWNRPWVLLLFFLFMGLASVLIDITGLRWTEDMGSWDIFSYFIFFVYGYLIFSNSKLPQIVSKYGLSLLIIAIVLSVIHLFLFFTPSLQMMYDSWPFDLRGLCAWTWILGLVGVGSRFLNINNKFLGYASEAVLPFYILHQPIILIIGYFVVQWSVGIAVKYLFIVVAAFLAIMVIYELLIRRINVLRFLFGMKLKKR